MRVYLGNGYTYNTGGEMACEDCGRKSPTLATITYDDGIGYGGTFCKVHSLRGADIGKESVQEIISLWNGAEIQAKRTVPFDAFCGSLSAAVEAARVSR